MLLRRILRAPRSSNPTARVRHSLCLGCRSQSVQTSQKAKKAAIRAEKVFNSVPRFLRHYTDGLRNAPISHVVAFLILHEITAIIPLVGLASWFHYTDWLPSVFSDSEYISGGVQRFGRYFRRKGWFGLSPESNIPDTTTDGNDVDISETGARIIVEVATAYAITKVLLPARLIFSVWLTPWFARVWVRGISTRLTTLGQQWKKRCL